MTDHAKEKYQWLAEHYAACARGERPERWFEGSWTDPPLDIGPAPGSDPAHWRTVKVPRECEGIVMQLATKGMVLVPHDWPEGMRVRVTEITEEE